MSVKPETAPYRAAFDAMPDRMLGDRRRAALARLEALGFPTRRDGAWRFTDLRPLQAQAFPPLADETAAVDAKAEIEAAIALYAFAGATHRLVFVNGRFAPALSRLR